MFLHFLPMPVLPTWSRNLCLTSEPPIIQYVIHTDIQCFARGEKYTQVCGNVTEHTNKTLSNSALAWF